MINKIELDKLKKQINKFKFQSMYDNGYDLEVIYWTNDKTVLVYPDAEERLLLEEYSHN